MSRVLLLDDEDMIRTLMPMVLEIAGVNAEVASSVVEAKVKAMAPDIGAVITDILLGSENGWDLVDYLKAKRPEVKIMVVSADIDSKDRAKHMVEHGELFAFFDKGKLDDYQIVEACKRALQG